MSLAISARVLPDRPSHSPGVVEREFVERSLPATGAQLYPIMRRVLDRLLKELPHEDDLLTAVRRTIAQSMLADQTSVRRSRSDRDLLFALLTWPPRPCKIAEDMLKVLRALDASKRRRWLG